MSEPFVYERTTVEPYVIASPAPDPLRLGVEQFLFFEAELLDNFKLLEWTKLLAPEIQYRMPIRSTVDSVEIGDGFSARAFHMEEDYGSLLVRMERLVSGDAWSEKPPSRTRRHVSNLRVAASGSDRINVKSNLLFFWAREQHQTVLSAERHDELRRVDGLLYLSERTVYLDHTVFPLPSLTIAL